MDKKEILGQSKRPVGMKKHVGIEIEFISPWEREDIQDLLCDMNLHANCTIKSDGSLEGYREPKKQKPTFKHECQKPDFVWVEEKGVNWHPVRGYERFETIYHRCSGCDKENDWEDENGYNTELETHEMTILTTEEELRVVLNKVNKVLRKVKAEVNKTCGLHVHLDMRKRDFKTCVGRLFAKQKEFRKMVAKHRLTDTHCRPLTKAETGMNPLVVGRYKDINMQAFSKFGTIEIRIHEGCVDTAEIFNWCRYLIAIVDNKKASAIYVKRRTMECA